jgi:hypothetical protein
MESTLDLLPSTLQQKATPPMALPRNESIYATEKQEAYVRLLRSKCIGFAKWGPTSRRLLRSEASREIEMLLQAVKEAEADRDALRAEAKRRVAEEASR